MRRRRVPRAAVAVGGDRRPGGTRLRGPGPEASGVARAQGTGLLQGVVDPGVTRIGAVGAEDGTRLFHAGVRIRDRWCGEGRGRPRDAAPPQVLQPAGEVRPSGVDDVEAAHHVIDRLAVGPCAHRMLPQAPHQLVEPVPGRLRAAGGEGAAGGGRGAAQGEELVQDRGRAEVRAHAQEYRAPGGGVRGVVRPGLWVDGAVDGQGADLAGEEVGVGGAEERAVRGPEVGELRVAHRAAEPVEVVSDVGGRHMAQQLGVTLPAAAGQLLERADPGLPLLCADRETGRFARLPGLGIPRSREAVHGGAVADPAGVPADDVEPLPHLAREERVILRHLDRSRPAGSAGVEEQGADAPPGTGRLPFDDGQFDGATAGVAVVQRHLRGRAVERPVPDAGFPLQPRGGRRR